MVIDGHNFYTQWASFVNPHYTFIALQSTFPILSLGYVASAYNQIGYGGSTSLECLPSNPTLNANKASTPAGRTLLTAVKYSLGEIEKKP